MVSKNTCSHGPSTNSPVFQTRVLLTRNRCGPGASSQETESPHIRVLTRAPSMETINCRNLQSSSDVRVTVTDDGNASSRRSKSSAALLVRTGIGWRLVDLAWAAHQGKNTR